MDCGWCCNASERVIFLSCAERLEGPASTCHRTRHVAASRVASSAAASVWRARDKSAFGVPGFFLLIAQKRTARIKTLMCRSQMNAASTSSPTGLLYGMVRSRRLTPVREMHDAAIRLAAANSCISRAPNSRRSALAVLAATTTRARKRAIQSQVEVADAVENQVPGCPMLSRLLLPCCRYHLGVRAQTQIGLFAIRCRSLPADEAAPRRPPFPAFAVDPKNRPAMASKCAHAHCKGSTQLSRSCHGSASGLA